MKVTTPRTDPLWSLSAVNGTETARLPWIMACDDGAGLQPLLAGERPRCLCRAP
jgi:hypothetical protein